MEEALIGGLIGIAGTLLGIFVSEGIKRIGKIKFIKDNIDLNFYLLEVDEIGGCSKIIQKENATIFESSLDLQIYNSKDMPKVFNKIKFVFVNDDGKKIITDVQNQEQHDTATYGKSYDVITNIKIEPKSLTELKLKCFINTDIEELKNSKMYLEYCVLDNGKTKEVFIKDLKDLD